MAKTTSRTQPPKPRARNSKLPSTVPETQGKDGDVVEHIQLDCEQPQPIPSTQSVTTQSASKPKSSRVVRKSYTITFEISDLENLIANQYNSQQSQHETTRLGTNVPPTALGVVDANTDKMHLDIKQHTQKKASRKVTTSQISLIDNNKTAIVFQLNMSEFCYGPLPMTTNKPCWWCRESFGGMVFGCPVDYHTCNKNSEEIKMFEQHLTNLNYRHDGTYDYFETEGVFCSPSCVKAYILENLSGKNRSHYILSLGLLTLLVKKLLPEFEGDIKTASTWKILEKWGGFVDIKTFREMSGQVEYTETINYKRPTMYTICQLIQEKK